MKDKIEQYEHNGNMVSVKSNLKGKHNDHCICFSNCDKFYPDNLNKNCKIANILASIDKNFGIITPIWECPDYVERK